MNADHRTLASLLVLAVVPWVMFGACAEGSDIEEPPGPGTSSGTGGGTGIPPGQVGGICEQDSDCVEGTCTQVGTEKYCTIACPPACPTGTYCAIIEGDSICIPDLGQQCDVCNAPLDCENPSDTCLTAPLGDKFCAIDCTTMGICPNGFTCVEASVYANGGSGTGGGGGSTSSGGMPPTGVPYKFCVPNSGASCPCSTERDGVTHDCSQENAFGTCSGTETCNGATGNWEGCTAQTPGAETCNGQDDDCNEQVDDGDPQTLCGELPPHSTWSCNAGTCAAGPCDPGWAQYPPAPPSSGCTCETELGEPNDDCAQATNAGVVSDAGGMLTLAGSLASDQDVDFWTFDTVDSGQGNNNTYHVSIDFTAPAPNDEFIIDVIRGDACVTVPTGAGTAITSYDWCVDGLSAAGNEGEAGCGPQAAVHCGDHSAKYYVRVVRKPGAPGTCAQYAIAVTATGGDACDFTLKCP